MCSVPIDRMNRFYHYQSLATPPSLDPDLLGKRWIYGVGGGGVSKGYSTVQYNTGSRPSVTKPSCRNVNSTYFKLLCPHLPSLSFPSSTLLAPSPSTPSSLSSYSLIAPFSALFSARCGIFPRCAAYNPP